MATFIITVVLLETLFFFFKWQDEGKFLQKKETLKLFHIFHREKEQSEIIQSINFHKQEKNEGEEEGLKQILSASPVLHNLTYG